MPAASNWFGLMITLRKRRMRRRLSAQKITFGCRRGAVGQGLDDHRRNHPAALFLDLVHRDHGVDLRQQGVQPGNDPLLGGRAGGRAVLRVVAVVLAGQARDRSRSRGFR